METELQAYLRRAALTLRGWATELAGVVDKNPTFGCAGADSEKAQGRLVDCFTDWATGLDTGMLAGQVTSEKAAVSLRETLLDSLFPWNRPSLARAVLGPELASHLRERVIRLTSPQAPGVEPPSEVGTDGPRLWTGRLLEDTHIRLEPILTAVLELVQTAPHLDSGLRQTLLDRVRSIRDGVMSGRPRELLSADLELAAVLGDLEAADRTGLEARSAKITPELGECEPRLSALEDRVRRLHESPLYGGQGAGTLGLVFLFVSLAAGIVLRDKLAAVTFIVSAALLNTIVWLVFNGLSGSLARPYMEALGRVKSLTAALKALQDPHNLSLARIADLRRRLRGGPVP